MIKTGSNGREYPSECHLKRIACENRMEDLAVVSKGHCNPCSEFKCDSPKECHVLLIPEKNNTRVPKCMCNNDCPTSSSLEDADIEYVCASNGKTVNMSMGLMQMFSIFYFHRKWHKLTVLISFSVQK